MLSPAGCEPGFSLESESKLGACSHLYDTSIVLGTHRHFEEVKRTVVAREMRVQGRPDPEEEGISYDERTKRSETFQKLFDKRFPSSPTFTSPCALGSLPAAAAAFLRTHEQVTLKAKITAKQQERSE